MKKIVLCGLAVFSMIGSMQAWADKMMPTSIKFAVVDVRGVIQHSRQLKDLQSDIKHRFSARQKTLNAREKKLLDARHKLNVDVHQFRSDIPVLNSKQQLKRQDGLAKRDKQLIEQEKKLHKDEMQFQHDVLTAQKKGLMEIVHQVLDIEKRLMRQKHLHVIFKKGATEWVDPASYLDLTTLVSSQLTESR